MRRSESARAKTGTTLTTSAARTMALAAALAWGCAGPGTDACRTGGDAGEAPPAKTAPATKPAAVVAPAPDAATPADLPGLHNVVAFDRRLISGAVPEGDAGFDALRAMGVRTIISVDGAEPDLARARARGMRYVHLPFGYNGFNDARRAELARATRDLAGDGPIYIHCHHGKHRSAAAAGAVGVSLGWFDAQHAATRMKVSGTAPQYAGLYRCVAQASPMSQASLDAAAASPPERTRPRGMVAAMVAIDEALDRIRAIERAGWRAGSAPEGPLSAADAGLVADQLRILGQSPRVRARGEAFLALLDSNQRDAQALEDLLTQAKPDRQALSGALARLSKSCTACHVRFRN